MLIYKALLATFGMGSALPFRVVSTALFLLSAALLFVFLLRRVGQWPALAATAVVLFLGAAWEDLLWSFQIGYFGSMAAGLGAASGAGTRGQARRPDRLRAAHRLDPLLQPRPPVPGRAPRSRCCAGATAAAPLRLRGPARSSTRSGGSAGVTRRNRRRPSPTWPRPRPSSSTASPPRSPRCSGSPPRRRRRSPGGLDWGRPLAVVAIGLACWRLNRLGRAPRWFWVVLAIGGSFWFLAGLNQMPGRDPTASRYQYIGVDLRPARRRRAAARRPDRAARHGRDRRSSPPPRSPATSTTCTRPTTATAAPASSRKPTSARSTSPATRSNPASCSKKTSPTPAYVHVEAGAYLSAAGRVRLPGLHPRRTPRSSPAARFAADKVLFGALHRIDPDAGIRLPQLRRRGGRSRGRGLIEVPAVGCLSVLPGGPAPPLLSLPPGGAAFRAGAGQSTTSG